MTKKTILAFCLILSIASFAKPIVSSISANKLHSISKVEPFQNPYVADGLVALWDGEWNAGFGKHLDFMKLQHIVNCVSNDEQTALMLQNPYQTRAWTIGNNFIKPNNIYGGKLANSESSLIADCLNANRATIEICAYVEGISSTLWMNAGDMAWIYGTSNHQLTWIRMKGSFTNAQQFEPLADEFLTIGIRVGDGNNAFFKNGVDMMPIAVGNQAVVDGFTFGDATAGTVRFHSIRIYNRDLTDDEMRHNFDVDKMRFGAK